MNETTQRTHEGATVLVRHLDDGFDPQYAIVLDATVVLDYGGPNGRYVGKANSVTVDGVPIKLREGHVRFADYHSDRTVGVAIDGDEARIETGSADQ